MCFPPASDSSIVVGAKYHTVTAVPNYLLLTFVSFVMVYFCSGPDDRYSWNEVADALHHLTEENLKSEVVIHIFITCLNIVGNHRQKNSLYS